VSDGLILGLYFAVLGMLGVFGLHRYKMLYLFYKYADKAPKVKQRFSDYDMPRVTVQLPVFNEMYVVERLVDAVCAMDYPLDRLQIQLLDDSTDETTAIAEAKVMSWRARGFDIELIHRTNRQGYKAGALDEAMADATGEFIVIFDADFVPPTDFLENTIHYFTDPKIGMVQTRWGHLNADYSLLTRIESIFLDGHFVIEQAARNRSGRFFNFNGTAGVWRTSVIPDAGGWQHDTLTEDMDLSYRAQLKGWEFIFLKDVVTPAELPVDMNAFKSQQHRWSKGTVQVAKKILGTIWRSAAPLRCKVEATFHLTMGASYSLMIMMVLLLYPVISMRFHTKLWESLLIDLPLFMAATSSIFFFYYYSQKEAYGKDRPSVWYLPMLISIGIGIVFSNAKATLEGLLGFESEFVRTPKHSIQGSQGEWKSKKYRGAKRSLLPLVELGFGCYMLVTLIQAVTVGRWLSLPFLSLFAVGFFYVGSLSLVQTLGGLRPAAPAPAAIPAQPISAASQELELEVVS